MQSDGSLTKIIWVLSLLVPHKFCSFCPKTQPINAANKIKPKEWIKRGNYWMDFVKNL